MKTISLLNILLLLLFYNLLTACKTHSLGAGKRQQLQGKVIVITGASSGLGKGIALDAGRSEATVILASRNKNELEKVAEEVRALGDRPL